MGRLLDRVTLSGADDSVSPSDMVGLAAEFPYAEWGILLSERSSGVPRYPSGRWLRELAEMSWSGGLALSAHLCGAWAHRACAGDWRFAERTPLAEADFARVQLNVRATAHEIDPARFARGAEGAGLGVSQYVFQVDETNDWIVSTIRDAGVDAAALYDASGGAGVEPESWPEPLGGVYCGYAGGLSPANVRPQLDEIAKVAGPGPAWIDAETELRSADGRRFDLGRVRCFLEAARPWVIGAE